MCPLIFFHTPRENKWKMNFFIGDQPWDFFGRNDANAETPVLWPSHAKSWLIGKDPDAGRDWGQEEKETTKDEMDGWHHRLDGCVWVNSGSWWWTGRPGVLRFMGSQGVGHDWVTELNWDCGIETVVGKRMRELNPQSKQNQNSSGYSKIF